MKKRMVKVIFFSLFVSVMLLTACTKKEAAQNQKGKEEVVTLMYGHAQVESHPYHKAFLEWADAVEKATNGGMKIDVYASNTLGSEEDIINSFKNANTNWGYNTDFARLGTYVKELALLNLPYFVETMEDIQKVRELDSIKEWIARLEKEYDIKVLSLQLVQGYRNVVTGREVKKPENLKGLTLRSPNTEIWRAAVSSLGCAVQGMGRGDIYNNLVNKVIDGYEDVYPAITAESYYEISGVKTISETRHILLINPTVVDAGWYNSLSPEYQKILAEECDKVSAKMSKEILETFSAQERQKCIDKGMKVIPYDQVDVAAFRKATEAAYAQLGLTEARNLVYKQMGK